MQLQPPPFPTSPRSPNDRRAGSRDPNPFLHQGHSCSSTSRPSPSQQQQFDEPSPRRSSPPPPPAPRQQQQILPPRQSPPSATVASGRYSAPPLAEQQQQYQQQRRWRSQDSGGGSGSGGLVRPSSSGFEEHRYDATELQPRVRRSSSDQRLDRRFDDEPEPDPDRRRVTNTPGRFRSQPSAAQDGGGGGGGGGGGSGRPLSVGRSRTGRTAETKRALRKRSQSVGDKMALVGPGAPSPTFNPQAPAQPNLLLYHVSRPEPRARWVFNLSKHTNVTDSGPPPETITSTIDKKRPNLGGLVWVNAVAGSLHCCLQKGVKNKAVTPVPANVLDGWLNGQTGLWWIGALKEGHRALWDSHVVMNWAMVFIPSSPEIAAKNNMEVWHDKCLPGSLRVARPGELTRKILDIVADDQDKEPAQVVHTHLCILLAEGDDLELKRPRMFSSATTPSPGETPTLKKALSHSRSISSFDLGPSLEKNGLIRGGDASLGAITNRNVAGIEEALEKVAKYRERIVILKDDRRAKKALVDQLRHELEEKEATLSAENERLRLERKDIKDRANGLWVDLENLRRDAENNAAENNISRQDREQLRKQVDRLRRERNSARADAMRWLEQQHAMSSSRSLPVGAVAGAGTADESNGEGFEGDGGAGGGRGGGIFPKTPGSGEAGPPMMGSWAQTAPGGSMTGMGDGGMLAHQVSVDQKAAATIAKLKNKVNRLRRERDDAEIQASSWLKGEQERMALNSNSGNTSSNFNSSSNSTALIEAGSGAGGGGGRVSSGGPVVASLKAESLQLKKELQNARAEAERLKRKLGSGAGRSPNVAPAGSGDSARGLVGNGQDEGLDDSEPQEARLALGHLLGQALNLLDPQAAADAVAVAAKRMSAPEMAAAAAAVAPLAPAPLSPQDAAGTMKLSTGEVSTSSTVQTAATEALSPQSVHKGTPPRAEEELEAAAMESAAAAAAVDAGGKAFVAGLNEDGLTGGEKKEVGASGAASNGAAAAASNGGGGAAAAPALSGVKAAVAAINNSGDSTEPRQKEVGRHSFTTAGLVGSKTINME